MASELCFRENSQDRWEQIRVFHIGERIIGMNDKVKLPIGIENFEKIRTEGFYYVDKTGMIKELLDNWGEVNLFTRPGGLESP